MIKKSLIILAVLSLAACSNFPKSWRSETGAVQHPDAFHSYID